MTTFEYMSLLLGLFGFAGVFYQLRIHTKQRDLQINELKLQLETLKVESDAARTAANALKDDHERSRNELTVQLLRNWTFSFDVKTSAIIQFAKNLEPSKCLAMHRRESFSVNAKDRAFQYLGAIFPDRNEYKKGVGDDGDGSVELDLESVLFIRFHTVQYLNNLESTLTAYVNHAADRDMLARQFAFILHTGSDLESYRTVMTSENRVQDAYPCISAFIQDNKPTAPKMRSPTGSV